MVDSDIVFKTGKNKCQLWKNLYEMETLYGRKNIKWDKDGIKERLIEGYMDLVGGKERLAYTIGTENVLFDDDFYELKWWRYVFVNMISLFFHEISNTKIGCD